MVGILEYDRYERQIQRELIRRIGYTNGLHEIHRFTRVIEYLYPRIPSTQTIFRSVIIEEEKKNNLQSKVSGEKYSQGIIDVANALSLINKNGEKLFLSDKGYALHALKQNNLDSIFENAFLLMSVLESDGEYFLNILDILANGAMDNSDIGKKLLDIRITKLFEIKIDWAKNNIDPSVSRFIVKDLEEAQKKFSDSLNPNVIKKTKCRSLTEERELPTDKRIERFREHTIIPRLGWLVDLGCVRKENGGKYSVTQLGYRLLNFFSGMGYLQNEVYVLPLSQWLAKTLGDREIKTSPNLFWKAVATAFSGKADEYQFSESELLESIKKIYPYTKLFGFNQTETSSIFHAVSCMEAIKGFYIEGGEEEFDKKIEEVVKKFPDDVFSLSKRRGKGGYISVKVKTVV